MPERVGEITPADVAEAVHELLEQPKALQRIRDELRVTVEAYSGQGREGEEGGERVRDEVHVGGSEGLLGRDARLRGSGGSSMGAADAIACEVLGLMGMHRGK